MGRNSARLLAVAALLALFASPARAACRALPIAEAPLAENWNFLVFPASIAGRPVSMLLDSGADAGLITEAAAHLLALPFIGAPVTIEGTGGTDVPTRSVLLRGLAIGGIAMPSGPVPVAPLPTEPRVQPPVAGLVGADLLARFEVDVDVPGHRLGLLRLAGACADFRPWPDASPVPLTRDRDRLLVDVVLDGHRLHALVDTGARSTILDADAAARIGLTAAMLAHDRGGVAGGVDLHPVLYRWHRFATLTVGDATLTRPVLTIAPVQERADLLLGADFFATRRVWLSYGTERMFIAPPPPAPAASASAR